jgi:hypothetical protein
MGGGKWAPNRRLRHDLAKVEASSQMAELLRRRHRVCEVHPIGGGGFQITGSGSSVVSIATRWSSITPA